MAAIEAGFQKNEIEKSAYRIAKEIDSAERTVVGLNRFTVETEDPYEPLRVDPAIEAQQAERLASGCAPSATRRRSTGISTSCARLPTGTDNVLVPMKAALAAKGDGRRGLRRAARKSGGSTSRRTPSELRRSLRGPRSRSMGDALRRSRRARRPWSNTSLQHGRSGRQDRARRGLSDAQRLRPARTPDELGEQLVALGGTRPRRCGAAACPIPRTASVSHAGFGGSRRQRLWRGDAAGPSRAR